MNRTSRSDSLIRSLEPKNMDAESFIASDAGAVSRGGALPNCRG